MIKLVLKRAVFAVALTYSLINFAWANELNTRALALAGEQKFDQALLLLSQQDAELQSGYEHRFLRARIFSWAGQYKQANTELDKLISEYPDNPDLQLAKGNLEYYKGNLNAAELYYQTVLDKFPAYEDARKGIANVRKAKSDALKNAPKKWRIDGGFSLSDFNDDTLTAWNSQFLRAEHTPDTLTYHTSLQRYDRFGETNIQIQAGLSDGVRGGWDWGLEAGLTPDALFRPKFSAGGRLGRAIDMENGAVLYPTITYRYDDYEAGGIHNIQPGLTAYLDKDLVLTGRLIGTVQINERDLLGWFVQGRRPVSDKLEANLGFAKAPEAINGVAISTQSLFGGLTYSVAADLDIHLNLSRHDRENSNIRNSVNVGFTHKR